MAIRAAESSRLEGREKYDLILEYMIALGWEARQTCFRSSINAVFPPYYEAF